MHNPMPNKVQYNVANVANCHKYCVHLNAVSFRTNTRTVTVHAMHVNCTDYLHSIFNRSSWLQQYVVLDFTSGEIFSDRNISKIICIESKIKAVAFFPFLLCSSSFVHLWFFCTPKVHIIFALFFFLCKTFF